jgi:hypothetical protein
VILYADDVGVVQGQVHRVSRLCVQLFGQSGADPAGEMLKMDDVNVSLLNLVMQGFDEGGGVQPA